MSRFSGILQLTDLDDFITPSQECTKPSIEPVIQTGAKISIQQDDHKTIDLKKVEISLADCLACSGCITSAETILITKQSQEEILKVFDENKQLKTNGMENQSKIIAITLSIQSIISLAIRYQLSVNECASKLAGYFKHLGADYIIDLSLAEDISLIENAKEFINRYQNNTKLLPMLASSCPGFVCYAEKTHGNFLIPYISTIKSPQQLMGSFVKEWFKKLDGTKDIYHVTVMPCYDKKLEASREQFYDSTTDSYDVDCVITSIEIEQMLEKESKLLNDYPDGYLINNMMDMNKEICLKLNRPEGLSGSGGFAEYIFKYAAKELFQIDLIPEFKSLRNPDFKEAVLEKDGKILLKFAIVNGFRNIQNLIQKMKKLKTNYHYVEIMACPSGCLNGGAQIRTNAIAKNSIHQMEEFYLNIPKRLPENNEMVEKLNNLWLENGENSKFSTSYRAVEKQTNALNIKW